MINNGLWCFKSSHRLLNFLRKGTFYGLKKLLSLLLKISFGVHLSSSE